MKGLVYSLIFFATLAVLPFSVQAAGPPDPPKAPFLEEQIAVFAAPDQLPNYNVIKYLPNAGISVVHVESGREWGQVQKLRTRGFRAGLNLIASAFFTPNDPLLSYQWHFTAVQAPSAWDLTTGSDVVVAVLDTGLATNGANDGIACININPDGYPGYDIVNNDSDPADGHGHGTHVSGTINQATNNNKGVAGIAHGACIMPVKVLDDTGSGSFADIADGIYWAVDNGAAVINMSLGTNARFALQNDPIMDPALDYAENAGVTVVCAAGNDGNRKNVSYPAIYPTTLAVGATDFTDAVPRYSNKGKGLDLVAPGGDMSRDDNNDGYADGVLQETFGSDGWGYYFFQGTSMAAPHVSAAAAMLIAHGTAITPDEVRTVLTSTAKDLGEAGFDKSSGWGLIQVYDALQYTGAPLPPSCTDADADGVCVEDGDCDDNNPNVYPGHNDKKGRWGRDGVDNNCNGIIDG